MKNKAWTTNEEKTLIQMRNNHMSMQKIAEMLDRPLKSISSKLQKLNCKINDRNTWSKEEWELAIKLRSEGKSYWEIGKVLNREGAYVLNKFRYEGRKANNGFSKVV